MPHHLLPGFSGGANSRTDKVRHDQCAADPKYTSVKADLAKWLPKTNAPNGGLRGDDGAKAKKQADRKAKKAAGK